jgi:hypothetical protein
MSRTKFLLAAALILAAIARPATSACPAGLAAKFTGGDQPQEQEWYAYLGQSLELAPGDRVVLQFAVNASFEGSATVGTDDGYGQTGYQVIFGQDLASDADYGDLVPVRPATHGAWHDIRAEFDIATQTHVISVDGVSSAPRPFDVADVHSIQAFRIDVLEGAHDFWIDSLQLTIENDEGSTTLLTSDFEIDPPAAPPGGLLRLPASGAGPVPPGCGPITPTGISTLTWSRAKVLYRRAANQ